MSIIFRLLHLILSSQKIIPRQILLKPRDKELPTFQQPRAHTDDLRVVGVHGISKTPHFRNFAGSVGSGGCSVGFLFPTPNSANQNLILIPKLHQTAPNFQTETIWYSKTPPPFLAFLIFQSSSSSDSRPKPAATPEPVSP